MLCVVDLDTDELLHTSVEVVSENCYEEVAEGNKATIFAEDLEKHNKITNDHPEEVSEGVNLEEAERSCVDEEINDIIEDMISLNNEQRAVSRSEVDQQQKKPNPETAKKKRKPIFNLSPVNKALKQQGKPYFGKNHRKDGLLMVQRGARELGPTCTDEKCRSSHKYCDTITEEERRQILTRFWGMSEEGKLAYISQMVERTQRISMLRRSLGYKYYVEVDGQRSPVCRTMFTNTLGLTYNSMRGWLKKLE